MHSRHQYTLESILPNLFHRKSYRNSILLLSGALSAVIGGGVGKFLLSSGVDPSKAEEMILDVAIGLAGEVGIAASEMFYKGATDAADWGERVFGQHVNDLDQQ